MKLLKSLTLDDQADIYADYLPNDRVFAGKKIPSTEIRKYIVGCSYLTKQCYDKMNNMSEQYNIKTTVDYISEWEAFVGIPDECFDIDVDIKKRREQVLTKMVSFNIQTETDFIELAAAFGVGMTIDNSTPFFPIFSGTGLISSVPPYDVPFTPSGESSQLACWITKLVDAVSTPTFTN